MMTQRRVSAAVPAVATVFLQVAVTPAQEVLQIDPYGATRRIPSLRLTGGVQFLDPDEVIDIVMLGDGYLAGERGDFLQDVQDFYDEYFHPVTGIIPYRTFAEAFRVRAVFTPSNDRANDSRNTYYRSDVTCSSATFCDLTQCNSSACWLSDPGTDNKAFRQALFGSIDDVVNDGPGANLREYPTNLSNAVSGGNIVPSMAGNYRNLFVGLIIRADEDTSINPNANERPAGAFAATASMCDGGTNDGESCGDDGDCPSGGQCRRVRIALAQEMPHEFGHAFGYLRDEYIGNDKRGSTAPSLVVPTGSSMSIFFLSNLGYTDDRSAVPWRHVGPGGQYNPNASSMVGNLFAGGSNEIGVWHSEYKCLMNGAHDNYVCDRFNGAPRAKLRDDRNLCFWCEEILTVRILERTGQFDRLVGSCADINTCGRTWWSAWESVLRDRYYQRNDLPDRIAERTLCYADRCTTPDCEASCDLGDPTDSNDTDVPPCLPSCEITELLNGIYVDSNFGFSGNPGTRLNPVDSIAEAVSEAVFTGRRRVFVNPGFYAGPIRIEAAVSLRPGACRSVIIGR